jgi:O-antigen ligase
VVIVCAALLAWISSPSLVDELAARLSRDFTPSHPLSRLYIWDHTLQIIGQHPITGVGAGNFGAEYDLVVATEPEPHHPMGHAHSDYLNIAALYGIPGLLLYLGMWGAVLRYLYRAYRSSDRTSLARGLTLGALVATVAFAVASLTEAAFADEEVRQLLMAVWGIGLAAALTRNRDPEYTQGCAEPTQET